MEGEGEEIREIRERTGRREGSSVGEVVFRSARSKCGGKAAGGLTNSRSARNS